MTEVLPQNAIKQELALVSFKGRVGAAGFLAGKAGGLEFFDEPAALAVRGAAIEAPGNHRGPIFDESAGLQKNFAAVFGLGLATLLQDAGVQFRAKAEAMPSFAASKSNPEKSFLLRQFPDRNLECFD